MTDPVYAAECDACNRFAVSTLGIDWDKNQFIEFVKRHVSENCDYNPTEITIVERTRPGGRDVEGPPEETVVDTVTPGVTST